jgi:hypothetical protein
MPTPINYNNVAYARQYKLINLHKGEDKVVNGGEGDNDYYQLSSLENSVKGSIALQAFAPANENNTQDKVNNYVPTFSPVLGE